MCVFYCNLIFVHTFFAGSEGEVPLEDHIEPKERHFAQPPSLPGHRVQGIVFYFIVSVYVHSLLLCCCKTSPEFSTLFMLELVLIYFPTLTTFDTNYTLQTTAGRDLKYASTVSYEKRARERDMETLTLEKMLAEDARTQDEENRPKTYGCLLSLLVCCLS